MCEAMNKASKKAIVDIRMVDLEKLMVIAKVTQRHGISKVVCNVARTLSNIIECVV